MEFSVMRQWAIEEGFVEASLCSAEEFSTQRAQVAEQTPLKERKQLRFSPQDDDQRIKSIAVLLWAYHQAASCAGRSLFVDSYYEASNKAYHAAAKLEKRLHENGVFAKANVSYPAKEAAMRAGLGIIGHNGLLIHPCYGSRVVIILMTTDFDVASSEEHRKTGHCLQCGRCISACPSGAIDCSGMSHPQRCLRNFMMEGIVVPDALRKMMKNRLLGCDMCQRVCPMQPVEEKNYDIWQLDDFTGREEKCFGEGVERLAAMIGRNTARPQRVRAQAALLCGNIGGTQDLPALRIWAESDFDAVREHARWAIKQIESKEPITQVYEDAGLDQSR